MVPQRRIDEQHDPMWRMSDELWNRVYPILLETCPPRKGPGRKPADWRRVLNGIVFRLRTGCHWNKLPPEFGDDSTIHRWYQRWSRDGLMPRILSELQSECGDLRDAEIESFAHTTVEAAGSPSSYVPAES
ncbi:MAG: transposase [Candidatus Saccharimonadales bacterium]